MDINQFKTIVSQKELTPKELAVLNLWNKTKAKDSKKIFSKEEIKILEDGLKGYEIDEYQEWLDLISLTRNQDMCGFAYFNQSLCLMTEQELYFRTIRPKIRNNFIKNYYKNKIIKNPKNKNPLKDQIFSTTLQKDTTFYNLGEVASSAFNIFSMCLISVLICQYLLADAFDDLNDLQCFKAINSLSKIMSNFSKDQNINIRLVKALLSSFEKDFDFFFEKVINIFDIKSKIYSDVRNFPDHIKRYSKLKINKYVPTLFQNLNPEPIFEIN